MYSQQNSSLEAVSELAQAFTAPATPSSKLAARLHNFALSAGIPNRTERPRSPEGSGEERPLEWHEVIELQAFSERKVWIEEKTRLLEQMPPIKVFVELDAVRASAEEVPGLPTREELKQWLAEHDRIEKETEVFDSGELRKLKRITKAAAQRNLSPADTDLIELTLTTIYALDKLFHLLRDRSDSLELLSDRLTWEEKRISSWVELRSLLADLNNFLVTRARWSPTVYDRVHDEDETFAREFSPSPLPTLRRKSSISSLMSTASDSTISSLALSRGERFKLAETLSRDAAQFASRVSSLRHSKITSAGKALDKLIDDSRKPVPDELLDEQDKLEDKGINEMEDVGKFVMAVVMQWKKADEIYVETAKDKSTAQTLLEEIEIAKLNHPSSRQDNSFLSRSTALVKRLQMRENPSSPVSFFPRPTHPLFSDQERANDEIVDTLSAELAATQEQAHEAERAAKEYHATLDKVKKVDAISKTALDLTSQLESLSHRLEAGIESDAGDGTPPTLSSESCLHSNSHSVFLAHVPELLETASKIEQEATDVISSGRVALAALPRGGIDTKFVQDSVALLDRLASYRTSTINIRSSVASKVATLRQCRSIWSSMAETFDKVDNLRHDVVDNIQRQMYKPNSDQDAALLTPESPSSIIAPPELTAVQVNEQLDTLASALDTDITSPLSTVSRSIGPALNIYLSECSSGLKQSIEELKRLTNTWSLIQTQAAEMDAISDDVHAIQMRSEHIKLEFEDCTRDVLLGTLSGEDLSQKEVDLEAAVKQLTADVQAFQDKLSLRLPFVSSGNRPRVSATAPLPTRRRFSISTGFSLEVVRQAAQPGLPFDAAALDRAVRADANSYSILLAGEIESLTRSSTQFHLAQQARAIDVAVAGVSEALHGAATSLKTFQTRLREPEEPCLLDHLQSLTVQVDEFYHEKGQALAASCLAARDLLERLGSESAGQDPSYDATVLGPRRRAVEEAEEKFNSWRESVEVFSEELSDMQHAERTRIEAEIAAQAAAEEAERLRLEEEERLRLEEEEKLRLEEEERRRVAEEERLRLEEEERLRLEKEERARLEEEQRRLAEEERMRLKEEERLRLAEEERLRLEEEERLRLAEEEMLRLAEKEKERLRLEEAERLRVAEEEERRRLEEERLRAKEEERLRLEEQERQRLEEENRLRLEEEERLRLQEERRLRLEEKERLRLQEEEKRLEEERLHREQAEEQHRVEMAILEQQKAEDTQKKAEAEARAEAERKAGQEKRLARKISKGKRHASPAHREDVFGISRTNSTDSTKSKEDIALQSVIVNLRKRLRSLNINEAVRGAASSLPSENTVSSIRQELDALQDETNALPPSIPTAQYVDAELRSLRSELEASSEMLDRMSALSAFGAAVQKCDDLLSDLLEHIDSYPAPPLVTSSSLHATDTSCPPENQMSNRLMFTEGLIRAMMDQAHLIENDSRVSSERNRIVQTWEELQAMGNDRVDGHKSRPPSALGSGSDRAGRASATPSPVPEPAKKGPPKKSAPYPGLSAAPPGGKYLAPPPSSRRSISRTSSAAPSRPSSRASTNRSVSGPTTTTPVATSRLYTSTFASRQRSSSITASIATIIESPSRPPPPPSNAARASGSRPRARTGQSSQVRTGSPLVTDVPRSRSRASAHAPRSSLSTKGPTWSRAPRQSFPNVPQSPPPRKPRSREKQPYVPNPDNKLDMAVGDVVNSLSANINIEVVADTWKDQSGKYWIGGDDDPKLCFCRILRSQTVMVRVGGGWVELSKFIKEHFADAFQILPVSESPPNKRAQGEKWISSVTLAQALSDKAQSPPLPPRTPEPQLPFVPTFALSTPGGTSPRTIKTSSPGSPLHAMQFIRRADPESLPARPETPTRAPRPSTSLSHNRRQPVWRP